MFDLGRFVEDCRKAAGGDEPQRAVRELVARAVAEPGWVRKALGEPDRAGIRTLYGSPDLTILDIVWAPMMTVTPHDHRMWAVIGVYGGREDNIFWRRIPGDPQGRVEAAGARSLSTGDVEPLGHGIIHSVTNPIAKLSGAIQVYGGDFFATERSEWDAETLREGRYDPERALRRFGEAEAAFRRR